MVAVLHQVFGAFRETEKVIVAQERDEVTSTLGLDITLEEGIETGGRTSSR